MIRGLVAHGLRVLILLAAVVPASGAPLELSAQESPLGPDVVRWTLPDGRGTISGLASDSALAAALIAELERSHRLPGLPDSLPTGVDVVLARDEATFLRAAGGLPPEWSAGIAIPAESRIVIPLWDGANRNRLDLVNRVMRHEWAHIGLHQHLGALRVPRWFSEGYAQWASGWDRGSAWRLRLLVAAGKTPPLDSLTLRFPEGAASAEVAYLLSATMIEYLVDESGEDGLGRFLERWKADGRFEDALALTYGLTPTRLEVAWKRWLHDRYGWLYILGNSGAGWGMLALLLVALVRIRRRRDREGMARLRADEAEAEVEWWHEPVPEGPREPSHGTSEGDPDRDPPPSHAPRDPTE